MSRYLRQFLTNLNSLSRFLKNKAIVLVSQNPWPPKNAMSFMDAHLSEYCNSISNNNQVFRLVCNNAVLSNLVAICPMWRQLFLTSRQMHSRNWISVEKDTINYQIFINIWLMWQQPSLCSDKSDNKKYLIGFYCNNALKLRKHNM